jgi:uncharacterized membrane protein YfcA
LSVVALGLMGTIHFSREGLVEWRKGALMALLIASGTMVGSIAGVDLSDALLDLIVSELRLDGVLRGLLPASNSKRWQRYAVWGMCPALGVATMAALANAGPTTPQGSRRR